MSGIPAGTSRRAALASALALGFGLDSVGAQPGAAPESGRPGPQVPPADRFACCNLRVDGRWVSDANWSNLPFLPAGASVRITGWGRQRVHATVDGRPIDAGVDYAQGRFTREQFADLLFVRDDPRPRIASFAPDMRAAIAAGRVKRGMTKEQVIVSLGYPRHDRTPDLAVASWVYFFSDSEEIDLDFDSGDRLLAIHATTRAKDVVWQPD